tara:strand:+ start:154 stop:564 length:411 start_codon:yes stop_codon:yes gene_type:complete
MDAFGIGQAMIGMARLYFQTSRRTGRTVSMINNLKDGDRVVFQRREEAMRVSCMAVERGLDIQCIVVSPNTPGEIFERQTSEGRTVFDHGWVEQFYMNALEQCRKDIDHLQRESSGFGEPHFETRRQFSELARWPF